MTLLPGWTPDWLAAALAAVFPALAPDTPPLYNGYVEATYHYAAALGTGRILAIPVQEGQGVTAGTVLVTLEDRSERAALAAAEAHVAEAQATLANLQTGSRADEIAVIAAELAKAQATARERQISFDRSTELLKRQVASLSQWQSDQAALDAANAAVGQLQAQLRVAELPARAAQQTAAEAALKAAEAERDARKFALDERVVAAPVAGIVDDIFFRAGEVAAAGAPVMSVYDPAEMRAIFFIPEPDRASVALGDRFALACDGCAEGLTAHLVRLGASPQHTPPIIYSREERSRLVFRAEAVADQPLALLPGQPVSLRPLP